MYEMLAGYPPFYSDEPMSMCRKVVNWRTHLKFPEEAKLTEEAKGIISGLLCDVEHHLGTRGVAEMKVLLPLPHSPKLLSEFVLPDGSTATHDQSS
ncbi:unnamed protein product [Sphagnum balticum]